MNFFASHYPHSYAHFQHCDCVHFSYVDNIAKTCLNRQRSKTRKSVFIVLFLSVLILL